MDSKREVRRDSSDNVHVIYQAEKGYHPKAFDGHLPPRYAETRHFQEIPAPVPGPTKKKVYRKLTFWILVVIVLVAISLGVGLGVGLQHKNSNDVQNVQPSSDDAEEAAASSTPGPTTVTYTAPPPVPTIHCAQMWEGTAPFCSGKCDNGWTQVRESDFADECDISTETVIIDSCANTSGNSCWTGSKVLCQMCS